MLTAGLAVLVAIPAAPALHAASGTACAACEFVLRRLDGGFELMLPASYAPTARYANGDGVIDSELPPNQASQEMPRMQVVWGYRSPTEAAALPCPAQSREVRIIAGSRAARAIDCEFDGALPGARLVFYPYHRTVSVETLPSAGHARRSGSFVLRIDYRDRAERELARRIAASLRYQEP